LQFSVTRPAIPRKRVPLRREKTCKTKLLRVAFAAAAMFLLFQTFLYAVIFREIELSLHALDNCRQGLARFFSIGGAEPNTSYSPICINAGRGGRPLDNNAYKSFATGARLFYSVRDRNL
jgi:hypothetical protein